MSKRTITALSCGTLLLVGIFLFLTNRKEEGGQASRPARASDSPTGPAATPDSPRRSSRDSNESPAGKVSLTPRSGGGNPEELMGQPRPEYVWYTSPTAEGVIKNQKGEVIFQATEEIPFYSMRSRADVSKVVVVSVNRIAFVIDPATKEKTPLPQKPPGENAKGFETWEWIGSDRLIAEYHVPAKNGDGREDGFAETKLYAYDVNTGELAEIRLPADLKGTAFRLGRVATDGSIEILMTADHLIDGRSAGWFNLAGGK